jgi:hypothetical protein
MGPADLFRALGNLTAVMQGVVQRYTGDQLERKVTTPGTGGGVAITQLRAANELSASAAALNRAAASIVAATTGMVQGLNFSKMMGNGSVNGGGSNALIEQTKAASDLSASASALQKAATAIINAAKNLKAPSYGISGMMQGQDGKLSKLLAKADPIESGGLEQFGNKLLLGMKGAGSGEGVLAGATSAGEAGIAATGAAGAAASGPLAPIVGGIAAAGMAALQVVKKVCEELGKMVVAGTAIVAIGAPNVFATLTQSLTLLTSNVATALTPAFTRLAFYVQDVAEWVKDFGPIFQDMADGVFIALKMVGDAFMTAIDFVKPFIQVMVDGIKAIYERARWLFSFISSSNLPGNGSSEMANAKTSAERVDVLDKLAKNYPEQSAEIRKALEKELKGLGKQKAISIPQEAQAQRTSVEDVRARVQNQGLGMNSIQQQILEQNREQFRLQIKEQAANDAARKKIADALDKLTR